MTNAEFNKIYQRSLPVKAAPLVNMLMSVEARLQTIIELQKAYPTLLIDTQIMVLGDEPFVAMQQRITAGYAAVGAFHSGAEPIFIGPVPPGYIKASLDPNDYPIHSSYDVSRAAIPFDNRWPIRKGDVEDRGAGSCWLPLADDESIVYSLWKSVNDEAWYEKQLRTDIFRGIPQIVWVRIAEPVPNLFA